MNLFQRGLGAFLVLSIPLIGQSSESFVGKIEFTGNNSFSSRKLKTVLELEEPRVFSVTDFDPRIQTLDAISLKTYYVSQGFLEAAVQDSFSIADGQAVLFYSILEGRRYYLHSVDIFGNEVLSDGKIASILGLYPHEPFNPVLVNSQLTVLEEEYQFHSKLFVSIEVNPNVGDSVKVSILINEGPNVSIAALRFSGDEGLNRDLVQRELVFKSSDLYRQQDIDDSKRRILETGLFSSARIGPVIESVADSSVDVLISVKPFPGRRDIRSDGGFDKIEISDGLLPVPGLEGNLEWLNRSLFGTTNRLTTQISAELPVEENFEYPRLRVNISLSNQWLYNFRIPSRIKGFFHLFKNFADLEGPFIRRYGVQISTIHRFEERSYVDVSLKWEKFEEPEEIRENVEQRKIDIHWRLDKTDNPFFPSRGSLVSLRLNRTGGFLGGTRNFTKLDFDVRNYISVFNKIVLAARLNYGVIFGWNSEAEQYENILYDKFYLGGSANLRAWDPLEFETDTLNAPLGKTVRLLINSEIRFPIAWFVGGVLFFDGGFLDENTSWSSLDKMKWDSGLGVTFKTPLGPIRAEYAFQLDEPSQWRVHLGVLYAF